MRILVLVTDAFGGTGGIAKFNRDLLTALCSLAKIEEIVAIPRLVNEKTGKIPKKLTYLLDGLGNKLRYSLTALSAAWPKRPFRLVICGHINLLPIAWLCSVITGGRLGLVIHGIDAWQPTRSFVINSLVKRIDFFISVSDFTKQKFCQWTKIDPGNGHILPNCIELNKFSPGPKSIALLKKYHLQDKKVIMTLGRMSANERYKGFDEILEILPKLAKSIPTITYLVIGDGDDRNRLKKKAVNLDIADRVIFTGRIPEKDKVAHYRLADVFAMPGRGEGFGIVYLEALACGIPVIGSKLDGSRDALLNGELGILVDPSRPDEILNEMHTILTREKQIPKCLDKFSFKSYKDNVHTLFNEM